MKYGYRAPLFTTYYKTFSIGICQMLPRKNGNGFKFGKAVVRVKARMEKYNAALATADGIVAALDSGRWDGRKTVKVV